MVMKPIILFKDKSSAHRGGGDKGYINNEEHLADLEVYCENQEKVIHMDGTATVQLLYKGRKVIAQ